MPEIAIQSPEQWARDEIDGQLRRAGWCVQSRRELDLDEVRGLLEREYPIEVGPMDYALFVDGRVCGVNEAKREENGQRLVAAEDQTESYSSANPRHVGPAETRFRYEATGKVTYLTDAADLEPRSREVFSFHQPRTLAEQRAGSASLRARLQRLPELPGTGLWDCPYSAINNFEDSLRRNRPLALNQMATGAGNTYMAITAIQHLPRYAGVGRVLFLADRRNLGAEGEFHQCVPQHSNRKFTELYTVQPFSPSFVPSDGQVCIRTIQRMYSALKGEEQDEAEEENLGGIKRLGKTNAVNAT